MSLDPAPEEPSGLVAELSRTADEIRRGSRRARLRKGLTVALFTLAATTLVLELSLRLSGDRRRALERSLEGVHARWVALSRAGIFERVADPVRRYAMRPGARCEVDGWVFRVSNERTRGPDVPAEKAPNEKRLLCLGDSFAFGLWCDEGETLIDRLARRASEREAARGTGITWRPLNLGVPGYHTGQQLRALEQDGLELEPDAVVLYFNSNDIERAGFFYAPELGVLRRDFLPLPTGLRRFLWDWSHLYGWIARQHARHVESGEQPYLDPEVPYAHVRSDNQAYAARAIARMAALCAEREIPFFLVSQPLLSYLGDTRREDWPVLGLIAWAEELRAELGLAGMSLSGFARGYADNVDRLANGDPPDFLLDTYFADAHIQATVQAARERASAQGQRWEELDFAGQVACFAGLGGELPSAPDFHLTGEGYAHVARLVYPELQAAGILP